MIVELWWLFVDWVRVGDLVGHLHTALDVVSGGGWYECLSGVRGSDHVADDGERGVSAIRSGWDDSLSDVSATGG